MVRFCLFLYFVLAGHCGITQKNYCVTYRRNDAVLSVTLNGIQPTARFPDWYLFFNDSVSHFRTGVKPGKNAAITEKPVVRHHSVYYRAGSGIAYSGVLINSRGKPVRYLIVDSLENRNWITWASTKTVLGYECRPFLSVDEKNDSLLIWYTTELPVPFGPGKYIDFSGLVLEVYDQRYGVVWKAVKIEEITATPVFPDNGIIITKEEFFRLKEK